MTVDYQQMKDEKDARKKEYDETYAGQLQLMGYIASLEKDNEHIDVTKAKGFFAKRRVKSIIKINNKDIAKYKKMLSRMPPVPEFK